MVAHGVSESYQLTVAVANRCVARLIGLLHVLHLGFHLRGVLHVLHGLHLVHETALSAVDDEPRWLQFWRDQQPVIMGSGVMSLPVRGTYGFRNSEIFDGRTADVGFGHFEKLISVLNFAISLYRFKHAARIYLWSEDDVHEMNVHPGITSFQVSVVRFPIFQLDKHGVVLSGFQKRKWKLNWPFLNWLRNFWIDLPPWSVIDPLDVLRDKYENSNTNCNTRKRKKPRPSVDLR